jgi:hypothetical protein
MVEARKSRCGTTYIRFVAAGIVIAAPTPCRARMTMRPFLIRIQERDFS